MELKKITEELYNEYATQHEFSNFLNSIYSGRKFKNKGWSCEYYALMDVSEIKAAALLVSIDMRFGRFFYSPRGFLIDYNDKYLCKIFTDSLMKLMKKEKGLYLKIDPYVQYQIHDKNGNALNTEMKNNTLIDNLTSLGFIHQGLTVGYDDTTQCRWMSVLDLKNKTADGLLKAMDARTRQNIKNSFKFGIKTKLLTYDNLDILCKIVDDTGKRRGFHTFPLEYYQEEYKMFKEHAQAYYTYLDMAAYDEILNQEIKKEEEIITQANENLINNPYSKNSKQHLASANQNLQSLMKRKREYEELKTKYDKEIPLAAALFIKYGKEVIYLTSGSYNELKHFKGPYAMQWFMIQQALEEGYSYYNFYGISGFFQENEDGYGVFSFKRGFNADVIELVGDFILPINKTKYAVYNAIKKVL